MDAERVYTLVYDLLHDQHDLAPVTVWAKCVARLAEATPHKQDDAMARFHLKTRLDNILVHKLFIATSASETYSYACACGVPRDQLDALVALHLT